MARQNYHTAPNRPGSPAVQHVTDAADLALYPRSKAFSSNLLENSVMRLHLQIRPSIARTAAVGALAFLFTSGMPLSAFGQAAQPLQTQQAAAARTPGLAQDQQPSTSSVANSTAPPTSFLSQTASVVTDGTSFGQAGLQQALRWGGGNYTFTFDGSRGTTNDPGSPFPQSLQSHMSGIFNQPLLRNFKIDNNRANLMQQHNLQTVADLQLQQRVTQTSLAVRTAYYNLVGAISGLDVANESLDLAKRALKDNQTRVEVGTMAPIDITAAEAEVASNEEGVILQQAAIQSAQDQLRTLVMNSSQPGFWATTFKPTDQPTLQPYDINLDAAVKNALEHRTDIQQLKKQMQNTDVSAKLAQNQRLPGIDLQARYGVTGIGGTRNIYDTSGLTQDIIGTSVKGFGDVLRDVFGNDFRTWSVALNFSYPLGTSQADAALAQARLTQKQEGTQLTDLETAVTAQVREGARQVDTNLKRVGATRKASELAQKRLEAENKRFTVGLSSTFELFQAQRDLSRAKQSELSALIDYNRAIVAYEAVQVAPVR